MAAGTWPGSLGAQRKQAPTDAPVTAQRVLWREQGCPVGGESGWYREKPRPCQGGEVYLYSEAVVTPGCMGEQRLKAATSPSETSPWYVRMLGVVGLGGE